MSLCKDESLNEFRAIKNTIKICKRLQKVTTSDKCVDTLRSHNPDCYKEFLLQLSKEIGGFFLSSDIFLNMLYYNVLVGLIYEQVACDCFIRIFRRG